MKKIVIVESGSTKADWVILEGDSISEFHSQGINPITKSGLDLALDSELIAKITDADLIHFYGAGANNDEAKATLLDYLSEQGIRTNKIEIDSDLLASVRATVGDGDGIVCILGTGSNSCLVHNGKIIHQVPSLGYLVSDEGSGNHIGKEILKAYFYGLMPEHDRVMFADEYKIQRDEVLNSFYKKSSPSAYLASFAPFLKVCSESLRSRILSKVFNEFVEIRIKNYPNFSKFDLYFTGSIAHEFSEDLSKCLNHHELKIKKTLAKPMVELIKYHKLKLNE